MKYVFRIIPFFLSLLLFSGCDNDTPNILPSGELDTFFSKKEQQRISILQNEYSKTGDPYRFIKEIEAFEKKSTTENITQCDIVFVGSSSFALWGSLEKDMLPLHVLNRGFGGSSLIDILYYADRIVYNSHPKKIVLYIENDIPQRSVDDTFLLFRYITYVFNQKMPGTKLYVASIKQSIARQEYAQKISELNIRLKNYFSLQSYSTYIDIASCLLNENGEPDPLNFLEDKLHPSKRAYSLWREIIFNALNK